MINPETEKVQFLVISTMPQEQANFWGCEGFCLNFSKVARTVFVGLLLTNFL